MCHNVPVKSLKRAFAALTASFRSEYSPHIRWALQRLCRGQTPLSNRKHLPNPPLSPYDGFYSYFSHFIHYIFLKTHNRATVSPTWTKLSNIREFLPSICKFHYSELCMFFLRRYRLPYLSSPSSALADRSPFSESHPGPRRNRTWPVWAFCWCRLCELDAVATSTWAPSRALQSKSKQA